MSTRHRPSSLNISLINNTLDDDIAMNNVHSNGPDIANGHCQHDDDKNFEENIVRFEGLSIGRNCLRIHGKTLAHSIIDPNFLQMEQTLGRGSSSRVVKAMLLSGRKTLEMEENDDDDDGGDTNDDENNISNSLGDNKKKSFLKQTPVALKQIPIHSPEKQRMLSKELEALAQMDCECLVQLLGAFVETSTVTLVLEFMDCGSLESLLVAKASTHQPPPPLENPLSAAIAYQALWGLAYLHYENRLHRDIKPANILLHSNGSVKLSDFGISSVLPDSSYMNTTVIGTMKYMSYERLRSKEYSKPSDVWSLGLVVLQCVTGRFLFADLDSVVELVVTLEDMIEPPFSETSGDVATTAESPLTAFKDHDFPQPLQELLEGFLQVKPEKRMPASILIQSPWFKLEGIQSLSDARCMVKKSLSKNLKKF